jgi:hypothetical protein
MCCANIETCHEPTSFRVVPSYSNLFLLYILCMLNLFLLYIWMCQTLTFLSLSSEEAVLAAEEGAALQLLEDVAVAYKLVRK